MNLADLASKLGVVFIGDASFVVDRVAALDCAESRSLCYVQDCAYLKLALNSSCGALIIAPGHLGELAQARCSNFLLSEHPHLAFAQATELLHPREIRHGIHPTAIISPDAHIDSTAWIGAYAVIEEQAVIGKNVQIGSHCHIGAMSKVHDETVLFPRVTVMNDVIIGARCRILSGAVIGSEGFGLVHDKGVWVHVPHLGRVIIGDDVDIGANTTVDRGTLGDTQIMDGVKIDNLVQVAHNVVVGKHSAIAGCAGLAGSSVVGAHCLLAGGVGLAGHLELADGVHVTGMSMVTKSIHAAGVYSSGTPLDGNRQWRRNAARFKSLDSMARRLARLERHIGFEEVSED
mgnify:CR=1 FL=1